MRTPRATKDLVLQVTAVSGELTQSTNRTPTDAELAAHLHVKADDIRAAILARRAYQLASLNMSPVGASDALDLIDLIGGIDPHYAAVDDHVSLSPLLATLPPRERHILYLRFYRAMSQSEIAAQVGVSQMQVCRLLRQSLTHLREAALDPHVS